MRRVIIFSLIITLLLGQTPVQAKTFSDIWGYWAEKEIEQVANLGLSSGYQGKFAPKGWVTRAEFAKLVVNALGLQSQADVLARVRSPFKDVLPTAWSNGYIQVAWELQLLKGNGNNVFLPDTPISRVEAAALLLRVLQSQKGISNTYGQTYDPAGLPFSDTSEIPDWAKGQLAEAVARGLVSGYKDGTYRPLQPVSRGEAAALLDRLLGQLGSQVQFRGTIESLDRRSRGFSMVLAGSASAAPLEFSLSADAVFYNSTQRINWQNIHEKDSVAVILDQTGKVSYLEVLASPAGNVKVEGQLAARPVLPDDAGPALSEGSLLDEAPTTTDFGGQPQLSLEQTKRDMNVDEMVKATGATGQGQIIAVIDTGLDPAHPDLQTTSTGAPKVIQYLDFTKDGKVDTRTKAAVESNSIEIENNILHLPAGLSKGGVIHYGFWREATIPTEYGPGFDLNGNGNTDDTFSVVVADSTKAGVFDTVIVDTNRNNDFRDDIPLKVYNDGRKTARFTASENKQQFGFVLAKMKTDGSEINLGFDSNGHGTHVAGIAAANGKIAGVAPGAQLMILKAVGGSGGEDDWSSIGEAVNYAANHGAKIVNLSLGIVGDDSAGKNGANLLLQTLMELKGVNFVVAAGNSGPGLGTLNTPADTDGVISVGAYISPAMWKQDYKWNVSKESLWFFSSMGPRLDGAMMPVVLAPGSAVSASPWGEYRLREGTSMAAPHTAGAVALLLDAAARSRISTTPATVRQALEAGAKPIGNFSEVEQGYGKVDLLNAWQQLKLLKPQPQILANTYNLWLKRGEGLYARGFAPGNLDYWFQSLSNTDEVLHLKSTQPWMKPRQSTLVLPKLSTRQVGVDFDPLTEPGLYTARLMGQVAGKPGTAVDILNTVINPYPLNADNGYRQKFEQVIEAGQFKRYFVEVPSGANSLDIALTVDQAGGQFQGRARLHLYNPGGQEVSQDYFDFAGVGADTPKATVTKNVPKPAPGVWEVVVYSSATLSEYNLTDSRVELEIRTPGVTPAAVSEAAGDYIVGVNPGAKAIGSPAGSPEFVTVQIRVRSTLQPFEGVIEVNSRLYAVEHGQVTIPITGDPPPSWTVKILD